MQKNLRFKVEMYMIKDLYQIKSSFYVASGPFIVEFKDKIYNFLLDIDYELTSIKKDSKVEYNEYHSFTSLYYNTQLLKNTNLIGLYVRTYGLSIDFKNMKDLLKFKLLFYTGDEK